MGSNLGPGSIIAGRYRLGAQLGQGGMGAVWTAEHLTLRSPVAVKLIDPEIADRPETLERFQVEAQAAASLRSPHVVQILDYGVDGSVPYIVMEMLDGESLSDRLARLGPLPYADTVRFVTHIARALSRAHEAGIVHRDLKPENVFLVRNDDQDLAKVLDFGIAKAAKPGLGSGKGPTRTGSLLGTPGYMSPEQAQGTKVIDGRSDVWSLGVLAFECVVGQVPFESEALGDLLLKICVHPMPVPSRLADVPPGFDAWFARACSRELDERFQTAKEAAEALRAVLLPDAAGRASGPALFPVDGATTAPRGALSTMGASPPNPRSGLSSAATLSAGLDVAETVRQPRPTALRGAPTSTSAGVVGTTVPGLSLGTPGAPRRSAGAYVAAALGLVLLGAAGTWIAIVRPGAARAPAGPTALVASSLPTVAPRPPPAEVTSEPMKPAPSVVAAEAAPPEPAPSASASASASAKAKAAPRTSTPRATTPPAQKPGDQRLGF